MITKCPPRGIDYINGVGLGKCKKFKREQVGQVFIVVVRSISRLQIRRIEVYHPS